MNLYIFTATLYDRPVTVPVIAEDSIQALCTFYRQIPGVEDVRWSVESYET